MTGSVEGILNTSLECENEGKYQRLKNNILLFLLFYYLYWLTDVKNSTGYLSLLFIDPQWTMNNNYTMKHIRIFFKLFKK